MSARSGVFITVTAVLVIVVFTILLSIDANNFPQLPRVFGEPEQKLLPGATHSSTDAVEPSPPAQTPVIPIDEEIASMTLKANKFTPEVLLSAPRRSAAVPNELGTAALYTVSTYSFESHARNTEIRLFDLPSKESTLVTNEEKVSEPNWLEGEITYLRGGKSGSTEVVIADIEDEMKTYVVGVVPGPISDVKLQTLSPGKVAFLCSGKATPEGTLHNPDTAPKKNHTGMLYDSLFVRHWDHFVDENRNALWYGVLSKGEEHPTKRHGRWSLSPLTNALEDTDLESPVEPYPGTEHFDLSIFGICFVAKAPDLDPAYNTRTDLYYLPVADFAKQPSGSLKKVEIDGFSGASTAPSFSSDGRSIVYLSMKQNGYESDKNRIILVQDTSASSLKGIELLKSSDGKGLWDRTPHKAIFTSNNKRLLLLAEDAGRNLLWHLDVSDLATKSIPRPITHQGHISEMTAFSASHVWLSADSLIDSSVWATLDPSSPATLTPVSSASRNGSSFGLSASQVSSISFVGANGKRVHAWVIRPSDNVPKPVHGLKWPVAMFVHGGPQGAWLDSWSTRWNPMVFAEQGYVVVAPNPTGSSGYGMEFQDAIKEEWGGAPYEDLEACWEYVDKEMGDEVDVDRAVALGASYGGYMMYWMQGHALAKKFMALVCHDGVFSAENMISSDEQYFPLHEFGGTFWSDARATYEKWDPARFTAEWSTPMLVIHSDKDYRLPISEGLAAFNVLQAKKIESRFLAFPDENHWVLNEENSLVWHVVVINWINSFVGLPPYMDEDTIFPKSGQRWRKPKASGPRK